MVTALTQYYNSPMVMIMNWPQLIGTLFIYLVFKGNRVNVLQQSVNNTHLSSNEETDIHNRHFESFFSSEKYR